MRKSLFLPSVVAALLTAAVSTQASLIQWLTATNVASVQTNASGTVTNWLDFFCFTAFMDRDGKYQLASLAESSFDPLARTTQFMLAEEAKRTTSAAPSLETEMMKGTRKAATKKGYQF